MAIWTVVGASRGIGQELVKQVLEAGEQAVATVRTIPTDSLWREQEHGLLGVYKCDMLDVSSIESFVTELKTSGLQRIDYLILNAGILQYPNRATEMTYEAFLFHLQTNTVGPIITAQKLLASSIDIGMIVFISSDSGSAQQFLDFEDGFAAYAASKAALNQSLRHMAAELTRKGSAATIIALHPGEVATDMANIGLDWEVSGQMSVQESVTQCLATIRAKTHADHGTFWTWKNEVYPW